MPAIVISILGSIVSGMVLFFLQRYLKKSEHREEERNKARSKENVLILKSIDAIGKLTYADAIAIRDGKTNGEMKAAIEEYNEVKEDMYNYLLEQNSKK
jgi:Mn2+/Fe2+ NRAMP family transporter